MEEAYAPFFGLQPPLIPYRDASFGICTYHLEVLDCVRALARAASLDHFNLDTFNADQYAFYDKIEHGDLNWIIPGKFVAFSGPLARYKATTRYINIVYMYHVPLCACQIMAMGLVRLTALPLARRQRTPPWSTILHKCAVGERWNLGNGHCSLRTTFQYSGS